jgi:hypothetical protein
MGEACGCELDRLYDGLIASDSVLAKAANVTEIARIARLEKRLRQYLLARWNERAADAIAAGASAARQGKSPKQIEAATRAHMGKWAKDVEARLHDAMEQAYRFARIAAWKRGTAQSKAPLTYDTPNFTQLQKAEPFEGFEVMPSFDVPDAEALAALKGQQTMWVGDHYDKNLSRRIQEQAASTMGTSTSHMDAAKGMRKMLRDEFSHVRTPKGFTGSAEQYMEGLAANALTTARAQGQLRSFMDLGYTRYKIVNSMDSRTCEVCGHMNGKMFMVEHGAAVMHNELKADSPEAVRAAHPWLRTKDVKALSPDKGKADMAQSKALAEAGFAYPPFHFRCRCAVDVDVTSAPPIGHDIPSPPTPKKPSKPRRMPASKIARKKAEGLHGTSFSGDGGSVESFNVHTRMMRDGMGQEMYEFQFKVTAGGEEAAKQYALKNGKPVRWEFEKKRLGDDGLLAITPGESEEMGRALQWFQKGTRGGPASIVTVGQEGALRNQVRIRVFTEDPKKALKVMETHAQKMGVHNIAAPPTEEALEVAAKAKLITQFDPMAARALTGQRVTKEIVDPIFENVARQHTVMREILADTKAKELFKGHTSLYSKAQADYFKNAGVKGLYHDASVGADDLVNILSGKHPGLMASNSRYDRGIFTRGMSTRTDFETGGADGVFTRVASKPSDLKGDYGVRFHIKTEEMGRQDWWAFDHDNYGRAGPNQMSERWSAPSIATDYKYASGSNEVMFQKGVPIDSIKAIYVEDEYFRERVINGLKERGITKLGKRKVESVIKARKPRRRRRSSW